MTVNRIAPASAESKGRSQHAWPDSLGRTARFYGDVFLDHDTERLAAHTGLSRREINRLRESGCFEGPEGEQRLTPVEKVARLLWAARELGFAHERCVALVQPILDALEITDDLANRIGIEKAADLFGLVVARTQVEYLSARADGRFDRGERARLLKILREARMAIDRFENELPLEDAVPTSAQKS